MEIQIDQQQMKQWIQALRSGKFEQTDGSLQNSEGYCCLGVACKLFVPKDNMKLTNLGYIAGTHPNAQTWAPSWLKMVNQNFDYQTGHDLIVLNDRGPNGLKRFTFEEIADMLEAVYILKVLE